ncbi:MAG: DUF3375 family protein [Planctomycetes bacterium]|nr:DUF3375 family protein [Planctomycetota bacterium]
MNFQRLKSYLDTAPSMRLFQARNVAYVVCFLQRQFKKARSISIPHSELLPALATFREEMQELDREALRDKPEAYLADWCEQCWLRRVLEAGRNEPVYQLTPHSEEVISFLDRALSQDLGFVGTESRLRTVIRLLDELVIGASSDPAVHLERLHRDQAVIAQEIERIEREGIVKPYGPTRIREQFGTAVDLLKQLQGDFRAVEDQFKAITLRVQQRHAEGVGSRGGILGDALDAEDALKREDQGISFFEFLRFIQSPIQQDRLHVIIQELLQIEELASQTAGMETVRRMVSVLLAEAEKVAQTTRRLSGTLRRLLDSRIQSERRRTAELLRQIRGLAATLNEAPPRDTVALEVDAEVGLSGPFSRTDWSPPTEFEQLDLTDHTPDEDAKLDAFRMYAALRPIDWIGIRRRIDDALVQHERLTLGKLVAERHPTARVVDVVGYLETAREQEHLIDRAATEEVLLLPREEDERSLLVTVPLVTFVRRGAEAWS